MAKPEKTISDKRIKRIFAIHRCLRDLEYHQTEEILEEVLKVDENTNERGIKADLTFMRLVGFEITDGNKHHGFKYKNPFSILEFIEGKRFAEDDELINYVQKLIDKSHHKMALDQIFLSLEPVIKKTEFQANPLLSFEEVDSDGAKRLNEFYTYMKSKKWYNIEYQPFGKETENHTIYPLILKEFNNRWYCLAVNNETRKVFNYPLDRIQNKPRMNLENIERIENVFDASTHFKDVIGVTVFENIEAEEIRFKLQKPRAYYVQTKKLHTSQATILEDTTSITFTITVKPNKEMWAKFFELAEDLQILAPDKIKIEMIQKLNNALDRYL